jgi:hypothetical protein
MTGTTLPIYVVFQKTSFFWPVKGSLVRIALQTAHETGLDNRQIVVEVDEGIEKFVDFRNLPGNADCIDKPQERADLPHDLENQL